MEEIKKCPFCNSPAELRGKNGGKWYVVQCISSKCGIMTPGSEQKQVVIGRWNNRFQTPKDTPKR